MLKRSKRICRLARLRNRHHQRAVIRHAVAVAILAGDLNGHRNLGDRLDPVLGRQRGVVTGAARQDQHAIALLEDLVCRIAKQVRRNRLNLIQRIGHRTRLLEDLLLHVVTVRAKFSRTSMHKHGLNRAINGLALAIHDPDVAQLQVGDVAVFQINNLIRGPGKRQRIGCEEVLALAAPNHQRRSFARCDDAVGFVAAEDGDGIGALQAAHGVLHSFEQIAVIQVMHQVRDHFGIGLAFEGVAQGLKLGTQDFVVLDDAVVHQSDARAFTV